MKNSLERLSHESSRLHEERPRLSDPKGRVSSLVCLVCVFDGGTAGGVQELLTCLGLKFEALYAKFYSWPWHPSVVLGMEPKTQYFGQRSPLCYALFLRPPAFLPKQSLASESSPVLLTWVHLAISSISRVSRGGFENTFFSFWSSLEAFPYTEHAINHSYLFIKAISPGSPLASSSSDCVFFFF